MNFPPLSPASQIYRTSMRNLYIKVRPIYSFGIYYGILFDYLMSICIPNQKFLLLKSSSSIGSEAIYIFFVEFLGYFINSSPYFYLKSI